MRQANGAQSTISATIRCKSCRDNVALGDSGCFCLLWVKRKRVVDWVVID